MLAVYINLDKRTDRRAFMDGQFARIGVAVERLAATSPDTIKVEDIAPLSLDEAVQFLSPPEIAISISQYRAWQRMLDHGDRHMLVLEDDVLLSPRLPSFVAALELDSRDVELLRLETRRKRVLLDAKAEQGPCGIALYRPLSFEAGSAAYIISATYAARILASRHRFSMPHDDILFSRKSPFPDRSRLWRAVPALALSREGSSTEVPTDIHASDAEAARAARLAAGAEKVPPRPGGLAKAGREISRAVRKIAETGRWILLGATTKKTVVAFAADDLKPPRDAKRRVAWRPR